MKFSQRMGIELYTKPIQIGSIDEDLRNTLWNMLTKHYWNKYRNHSNYPGLINRSNFKWTIHCNLD